MKSFSLVIFVLAILICSCHKDTINPVKSTPAIVDTPQIAASDFPQTIGDQWVYRRTDSITNIVDTFAIKIVGRKTLENGELAMMWEYTYSTTVDTLYYSIEADTVKQYANSRVANYSHLYIYPLYLGKAYQYIDSLSVNEKRNITANNILYPNCYYTSEVYFLPDYRFYQHSWLDKKVGVIKQDTRELSFGPNSNFSIELLSTNIR